MRERPAPPINPSASSPPGTGRSRAAPDRRLRARPQPRRQSPPSDRAGRHRAVRHGRPWAERAGCRHGGRRGVRTWGRCLEPSAEGGVNGDLDWMPRLKSSYIGFSGPMSTTARACGGLPGAGRRLLQQAATPAGGGWGISAMTSRTCTQAWRVTGTHRAGRLVPPGQLPPDLAGAPCACGWVSSRELPCLPGAAHVALRVWAGQRYRSSQGRCRP